MPASIDALPSLQVVKSNCFESLLAFAVLYDADRKSLLGPEHVS